MINKIIFLDIDGVLNSAEFFTSERGRKKRKETSFPDAHLDEAAINRLNVLVDHSQAQIVISSTWRELDGCVPALQRNGLRANIIGKTPHLEEKQPSGIITKKSRGEEIQAWLDNNEERWDQYIIIDDDSDMLPPQKPRFIHTSALVGFDQNKLKEAIKKFSE